MKGLVEVGIKDGLGIGNREDWNDFEKDEEEEDFEFCRKILDDSSILNCMY